MHLATAPLISLLLGLLPPLAGQEPPTPERLPPSQAYQAWRERHRVRGAQPPVPERASSGAPLGYVPSPVIWSREPSSSALAEHLRERSRSLPAAYDLRALSQSTPARDQSPYGTCWVHGALASLESGMLKRGIRQRLLDLSEWHLGWFAFNRQDEVNVAFTPYGQPLHPPKTFDYGGNPDWACALLLRGTGPVAEEDCPYRNHRPFAEDERPTGRERPVTSLKEMIVLDDPDPAVQRALVKAALVDHGAVAQPIGWEEGSYAAGACTYRDRSTEANHMVTLLGWDDRFPASGFPEGNRPAEDGAWIAKNSWGESWGDRGCFHISYDTTLAYPSVFVPQSARPRRLYQHDPLGMVRTLAFDSGVGLANVFTCEEDGTLRSVSLAVAEKEVRYEITVHTGVRRDDPESGARALGPVRGVLKLGGYRKIVLPRHVPLKAGQDFSVVVRLRGRGSKVLVPAETVDDDTARQATAAAGQSLVWRPGDAWRDLTETYPGANLCIKAWGFAQARDPEEDEEADEAVPEAEMRGGGGLWR